MQEFSHDSKTSGYRQRVILCLLFVIVLFLVCYLYPFKKHTDSKNSTYIIEGKTVTLVNGMAEEEVAPGSASKLITRYFGNEIAKDFDGDGREDKALILTQESGGSGVFFYVTGGLNTEDGFSPFKDAYFLGDRIALQSLDSFENGEHPRAIVVNYADREAGEDFSKAPSVGKSVFLEFDPETLKFKFLKICPFRFFVANYYYESKAS